MKRRHVSATLLMALALTGCGMNPAAGPVGSTSAAENPQAQAQAQATALDPRYRALTFIPECPTLTGSDLTSTGSTTTSVNNF